MWKKVAGLGTALSLAATLLLLASIVIEKFVEVYLPVDAENPTAGEPLATVGVFTSTYDPSNISPEILAQTGLPSEVISTATTNFPLLFPAQSNFVAEVLPINFELLAQLDAALFGGQPIATNVVEPTLTPIVEQEFDTCEGYLEPQVENLNAFFGDVVNTLLPGALPGIFAENLAPLNLAIDTVAGLISSTDLATNIYTGILIGNFNGVIANCAAADSNIQTVLTAAELNCVAGFFGGFGTSNPFVAAFGGLMGPTCALSDGPFVGCLAQLNSAVAPGILGAPVSFIDTGGSVNVCTLLGSTDCSDTLIGYLVVLQQIASVNNGADLAAAIQGILGALNFQVISGGFALTEDVGLPLGLTFPPDFDTTFFLPCAMLQLAAAGGTSIPGLDLTPGTCPFGDFFQHLAGLAPADLAPLLGQIHGLFDLCRDTFSVIGDPGGPGGCITFFSSLFLNIAFTGDLNLAPVVLGAQQNVTFQAIVFCEDQAIDLEKVGSAQVLIATGIVTGFLACGVGLYSVYAKNAAGFVLFAGVVLCFAAAVLTISSLLVIQTAPVYDSVGGDPEASVPFYDLGIVSLLAVVCVALYGVSALLYFGSGVAACLNATPLVEAEEVKEDIAPAVEKEEEVVVEEVKEDEEAKPSV